MMIARRWNRWAGSLAAISGTAVAATLAGCPVPTDPKAMNKVVAQAPAPVAVEGDPRVERDGEDLYPTKTMERRDALQEATNQKMGGSGTGLGSGRPDETNGVCRLYAPELPNPECCVANLGFDVQVVQQACGLPVYLGESFQASCGHFFTRDGGGEAWFRISHLAESSVATAIGTHMRQPAMRDVPPATGWPGLPEVRVSRHVGYNWAYFPGFDDSVRLLTWRDGTCSEEGITTVIRKLLAAKKPAEGAARSLLPTAQY